MTDGSLDLRYPAYGNAMHRMVHGFWNLSAMQARVNTSSVRAGRLNEVVGSSTAARSNWNQRAAAAATSCAYSRTVRSASMVRAGNGASTYGNEATSCHCANTVDRVGCELIIACDDPHARGRGEAPYLVHPAPRCVDLRDSCAGPDCSCGARCRTNHPSKIPAEDAANFTLIWPADHPGSTVAMGTIRTALTEPQRRWRSPSTN